MHANLDISGGAMMAESLMMALAPHIGRGAAHELVGELVRRSAASGSSLVQIASRDDRVTAHLDAASIAEALDPSGYLGIAEHRHRRGAGALGIRRKRTKRRTDADT
jgi:3-carboxy-cis,cis-muconate cycloisomerase